MANLHVHRWKRWGTAVCLLALLAVPAAAGAQTGSITGQARDRTTGEPLNGVQVSVEGTSLGGLSDARGRYLIQNVPAGQHTLNAVYIGYRTEQQAVTVTAGGTASANFEMGVSAVSLDEVIVTGTAGAVERRQLGATVASVDVSRVQDQVPVADISSVLSSRVAGLRSINTTGGAGAGKDLRIRGTSSLTLGQRPVIYVDGVRVDNSATEWGSFGGGACCSFSGGAGEDRLSDINPNDIDRIEIIKGAAAGTLYGSEATNGVIQIFTKKGRSDSAPRWSVSATTGFSRLRENIGTKLYPNFAGPDGFAAWDANEHLIENGPYQALDVTVQGGGNSVTYFVSGGYMNEEGSIQPNYARRGTMRVNLSWLPSQKLSFDVNSAFTKAKINSLQSGNNWTALYGNAVLGNPLTATTDKPYGEPWVAVSAIKAMETFDNVDRWTGGVTMNYAMTPSLTHRVQFGLDAVNEEKTRLFPFGYNYGPAGVVDGEKNLLYRSSPTVTADYLGSLDFGITEGLSSRLSVGAQGFWVKERRNTAIGKGFAGPGVSTVDAAKLTFGAERFEEEVQVGVFGQNRFAWQDKLFLTTGLRVDGNSAFGDQYGFQLYPNVQLAYSMSDESWVPDFFSDLRVRGAVGTSGLAPGAFDKFLTFEPFTALDDQSAVRADEAGNDDLAPEKTTEYEVGFDAGVLNGRLGLEFTAYRRDIRDLIATVEVAPSQEFGDAANSNIGSVRDEGLEVTLRATAIESGTLRWTTDLRFDTNRNEITDLGTEGGEKVMVLGSRTAGGNQRRVGYPVLNFWQRPLTGYDPATRTHTRGDTAVYSGQALPKWNLSFGNQLAFGPFVLYGLVSAEKGAIFNNSDRPFRIQQDAGDEYLSTLDAQGNTTAMTDSLDNYYRTFPAYDKRDNVRIREVTLGYLLPEVFSGRLGLGRTTLTLAAKNVHWWDDCNCEDPNMNYLGGSSFSQGSGFLATPAPRQFLLTVRTSF
jgi:TonB-dependent SusC/RagA subfamily outer membrane receptor